MQWKSGNGLRWLEYDLFATRPKLRAATLCRQGGVSLPPFDSLNLRKGVGDSDSAVDENWNRVTETLQIPRPIAAQQVHGTHLEVISTPPPSHPLECDGFITSTPGVALMILHADCQAAVFYDPVQHVVAAVHAGWRGLVQNMYAVTIERLCRDHGCQRKDLRVAISPSLGPKHSEFIHYHKEIPEPLWRYRISPTHFDLWEIARAQLLQEHILPDHVEISALCTYSHPEDFYSYRRDKRTGRNGTLVYLF